MDVEFANSDLEAMEQDGVNCNFSEVIGKGFRKVLNFIRNATDERDFRSMRSLNFEKLQGDRSHQHSLRINQQWRLIIEIKKSTPKNTIWLVEIKDYHK